jgi:hypothetical protein
MEKSNSQQQICDEAEKSFFKCAELQKLVIDQKTTIEHNLNKWNMTVWSACIKGNRIYVDIVVPYSEMHLEVVERQTDGEFFSKNTAIISISGKPITSGHLFSYFSSKTVTINFDIGVKYMIFKSPYFYPHNWYLVTNKDYLYKKIAYSVNFMQYFIKAYIDVFQTGVPLIYVNKTKETKNTYEIELILKEYLTISYVKTDVETATLYFHMMIESDKKSTTDNSHVAKYHKIIVNIPREIRKIGNVYFKFTANMV